MRSQAITRRLCLHGFVELVQRPSCLVYLWWIYQRHGVVVIAQEAGVHRFVSSMVVPHSLLLQKAVSMAPPRSFCLLVICSTTGRDTAFSRGGSGSSAPLQKKKQLPLDCNFAINPAPSATLTSTHELIIYSLTPFTITLLSSVKPEMLPPSWKWQKLREENKGCVGLHYLYHCVWAYKHIYIMKLGHRLRNELGPCATCSNGYH